MYPGRRLLTCLLVFMTLCALAGCAADAEQRVSVADVAPLVREYAFEAKPTLNPETQFEIEEYDVPGMWRDLRVQLFLARYVSPGGGQFNESLLAYHDGELTPFACTFGGHGLMSAVMMDGDLYYTDSCGLGRHLSSLGRLSRDPGTIAILRSGRYLSVGLFVRNVDGRIQVETGRFVGFNSWQAGEPVGWLKADESSLAVIDATGKELSPDFGMKRE